MIVDTISSHTYGVQFATLEAFFFLTLEASATNTLSRKNTNFSDYIPKNQVLHNAMFNVRAYAIHLYLTHPTSHV